MVAATISSPESRRAADHLVLLPSPGQPHLLLTCFQPTFSSDAVIGDSFDDDALVGVIQDQTVRYALVATLMEFEETFQLQPGQKLRRTH